MEDKLPQYCSSGIKYRKSLAIYLKKHTRRVVLIYFDLLGWVKPLYFLSPTSNFSK